jgi:hypothetical protein
MSKTVFRRAALDEETKKQLRDRVQEILQKKQKDGDVPEQSDSAEEQENPDGTVYLFDASDRSFNASMMIALEFQTRKEYEIYKKDHEIDTGTKIKILDEGKEESRQEDKGEKRGPGEEEKKKPKVKKTEKEPVKQKSEEKDEPVKQKKPEENKNDKKPGEPLSHDHPSRIKSGPHRSVAIKDSLYEEFGADAKNWKVYKIHPSQLSGNVDIKFPDGKSKKYGELSPDEKTRVDKAVGDGLAASKGLSDYSNVSPAAFKHNQSISLGLYDNKKIQEVKNENEEPTTKENVEEVSSSLRENGRTLLQKYAKSMSRYSRPMAEKFVDHLSDSVTEGIKDGSLNGVKQNDLDEFVRESVKRLVHQEVETRRRSLGDHGIRHVAGNCQSSMDMLGELQKGGIKITGKQKLMALATMSDHDIGYTVGDVGTDISKGKNHKDYSKDLSDQEPERFDKVFGEDAEKVRTMIATHDDPTFDWDKDPVGSVVRLADNTALFGKDKVQDLFLRSPKATSLACKLRLAAEAKPGDKKLQDEIKQQIHEVIDDGDFEQADRESLHNQVKEMSEGKFSTTVDILSRFSGKLEGFKYDSEKKLMHVNMKYSSEGQMVEQLFGDEVACKQFDKFAKDMYGKPIRGKRGETQFKSMDAGEPVFQLNIDGFDGEEEPATEAMRDFASKTARTELRKASMSIYPPPKASERDVQKAKKALESGKDKFSKEEWTQIMGDFDEASKGDLDAFAKKLSAWPLLKSESAYLESKTAAQKIARRLMVAMIADKIALDLTSGRGNQLRRKDKDLMVDTGGISKNRRKTPNIKPPRSDSANRYRTKDKPADQRDPDVDRKEASVCVANVGSQAKAALASMPKTFREAVQKG